MSLGIGVIGVGIMGADHVQTITTAISGAEVRAVADIDPTRAEMVASRAQGARPIPSAESLIQASDVDALIIASNDETHAPYVLAGIAAGKPVLCEKPLAPTVAECEEILTREQATGTRMVQVGFMRRFDPGYVELRTRIAGGMIGTPMLAHCVHRNVNVPSSWTSETIVLNAAVHEVDVMPWLFGQKVVGVNWMSPIPAATDKLRDPQIVILELEGGALVIDELFMNSGYGYEIRCEIVGEKGTIELAPFAPVATRSDLKVHLDFPPDWRGRFAEAYRRELQSWVDAVMRWRSGKTASGLGPVNGPDAWDGYCAAVTSQALLLSMSRNGRTTVESKPAPELYCQSRNAVGAGCRQVQ
jgi:myo-inositol 2-dehydrogenase / D-chiro-inositol 1-dehydrogenase